MILLIMGVAGAGKTTVGRALAAQLGWHFADADEYHSPGNVAKMGTGIPLTDADRAPWLHSLRNAILSWIAAGQNVVLACSALKAAYRDLLVTGPEVKLVFLKVEETVARARLQGRSGHYMHADLVRSQFETLEEPRAGVTVEATLPVEKIVAIIRDAFGL